MPEAKAAVKTSQFVLTFDTVEDGFKPTDLAIVCESLNAITELMFPEAQYHQDVTELFEELRQMGSDEEARQVLEAGEPRKVELIFHDVSMNSPLAIFASLKNVTKKQIEQFVKVVKFVFYHEQVREGINLQNKKTEEEIHRMTLETDAQQREREFDLEKKQRELELSLQKQKADQEAEGKKRDLELVLLLAKNRDQLTQADKREGREDSWI